MRALDLGRCPSTLYRHRTRASGRWRRDQAHEAMSRTFNFFFIAFVIGHRERRVGESEEFDEEF